MEKYIAVIQAGGMGTRMLELTKNEVPKPLFPLDGRPMMQWQIELLKTYNITEIIIIIGYLGDKIKEYFKDGKAFGVNIRYIEEKEPLGSAGALYYLKSMISCKKILLIFGDVMFNMDINRMIRFHEEKQAQITLLVHPNSHPNDSDVLRIDEQKRVIGILPKKEKRKDWYDNCTNAGIYILEEDVLKKIKEPKKIDLEKELILPLITTNTVYGYHTTEYIKDAGTVSRFFSVERAHKNGIWDKKNLKNKQRCIFLDRDGTVNVYKGLVSCEELFELEEGVATAIRLLNEEGYLVIVVTNQPVVARGMCDIDDVKRIHRKMQVLLGEQGAYVDDIVFCPHHPDKGYPEENPEYKIICDCRKPATGMIDEMVKKYNIDIKNSYIIGDSTIDIELGRRVGLKTILVKTGLAGKDAKFNIEADLVTEKLKEAVLKIIQTEKN